MIASRVEAADGRRRASHKSANAVVRGRCGFACAVALCVLSACGKKGPPLPPLVRMPAAPGDLTAQRRGDTVDVQFVVPAVNTDGTRPANESATDVYAITAPASAAPPAYTDAQLLKYGKKIATVAVKAPRDPSLAADPDEPADEVEPAEGPGLDQGATAHVSEPLGDEVMKPTVVPPDPQGASASEPPPQPDATPRPLLGPSSAPLSRIYAAVGVSTRGKRGPFSRRIAVPLVPPPAAPAAPTIEYDETKITVTWPALGETSHAPAEDDVLPARIIGAARPEIAYNVYDVSDADKAVKLTSAPVTAAKYEDTRLDWGAKRCYVVRAAERIAGAVVESDPSTPACETLTDTFPPAAPKALGAIASEGAINLIWEPNTEKDLAGYLVLRGTAGSATLQPITPMPIQETSFRDGVPPGVTYIYAVKAVDRAGNASDESARVSETAR